MTSTHNCPPWARMCSPDSDGSVYHQSAEVVVPLVDARTDARITRVSVAVSAVDDPDAPEPATVDLLTGQRGDVASLTPAEALTLAETLREHALVAAGPAGVDMTAALLRPGDEILIAGGDPQTVENIDVDSWCCGRPVAAGHQPSVQVCTDRHRLDDQAYLFDGDELVRVRRAVTA